MCDDPVDVKFEPCGHAMMCSAHAQRAKRCPTCKVPLYMSYKFDSLGFFLLARSTTIFLCFRFAFCFYRNW